MNTSPAAATRLPLRIAAQPDDTTCGPTCLDAVYRFHGMAVPLPELVAAIPTLPDGGTLAVHLGRDALARGFRARIHSWNLHLFDPSWFDQRGHAACDLDERLTAQARAKPELQATSSAYRDYLAAGGQVHFGDLDAALIRRQLKRGRPLLTGLSATYLYRTPREIGATDEYDDLRGEPSGHFVVLSGYTPGGRLVQVHDPLARNPVAAGQVYTQPIHRVIAAVMLGVLTHDANLLVIIPPNT